MHKCAWCPRMIPQVQKFCSEWCLDHYEDVQAVKEVASLIERQGDLFLNRPP